MKQILLIAGTFLFFMSCTNAGKAPVAEAQHDPVLRDTILLHSPVKNVAKDSILQNGEYIERYTTGVVRIRGMMKDGQREGLWKSFYDNGSPWSETTFEAGKKQGPTTTWYENEKKRYTGFYKNDEEAGNWMFWDEKGKVITVKNYDQTDEKTGGK
ncbi:MAG: hypothetical protein JWP12_2661 [Bacteroidetes bacterium]|nr:hypothetical protein [Bacteroidota bacterium]